jgi:hypothetical protein
MLFPEGIKCKNAHPEGIQVSSRGVNYTDFFVFQRGNTPKSRGPRQGGVWFLNVIAQYDPKVIAQYKTTIKVWTAMTNHGCPNFNRGLYSVCLVLK